MNFLSLSTPVRQALSDRPGSLQFHFDEIKDNLVSGNAENLRTSLAAWVASRPKLEALTEMESHFLLAAFMLDQANQQMKSQELLVDEKAGEVERLQEELAIAEQVIPSSKISCVQTVELGMVVNAICEIPETNLIVTAAHNGQLHFFNADDVCSPFGSFEAHTGAIYSLLYHQKSHYMISASADQTIKIWAWNDSISCKYTLEGHKGSVYDALELMGGGFASVSRDETVKIWEPNERRGFICMFTLTGHKGSVTCVRSNPMEFLSLVAKMGLSGFGILSMISN